MINETFPVTETELSRSMYPVSAVTVRLLTIVKLPKATSLWAWRTRLPLPLPVNLEPVVRSLPKMMLPPVDVMEMLPVTAELTVMPTTTFRLFRIEIVASIPNASLVMKTVPPSSRVAV